MPEMPQIKTLNPLPRSASPPLANLKFLRNKDFVTVVVYGKGGVGKTFVGISKTPTPVEWIDVDHRSNTQFKRFKHRIGGEKHLFFWDDIPENNKELIDFLTELDFKPINTEKSNGIIKINGGNEILYFKLNDTEIILEINNNIFDRYFTRNVNNKLEVYDKGTHVYTPNTTEEIENAVAWAISNLEEHYKKTGQKGTIVFDSYTKAKEIIKEDYLISQKRPVNDKTSIEDKSIIKKTVMRIIDNIKHSQMNVVVTAEQGIEIIGEEKDGKSKIKAVLSGIPKSEDDLEYFCDFIVHLYEAQVKVDGTNEYVKRYLWEFRKSSTSRILERTDLAPKEDCDWEKLMAEIELLKKVELQETVKK